MQDMCLNDVDYYFLIVWGITKYRIGLSTAMYHVRDIHGLFTVIS